MDIVKEITLKEKNISLDNFRKTFKADIDEMEKKKSKDVFIKINRSVNIYKMNE